MTNLETLDRLYTLVKTLDSDSQAMIARLIRDNRELSFDTTETAIANMIIQLKQDITTDEAKKSGKSNQLKAIKTILKSASKQSDEALHYAKTIDGFQYVCDGYILAKIKPIDTLPECPDTLQYPNVLKFFDEWATHTHDEQLIIPDNSRLKAYVIVPDNSRLKAYIKDQKLKHKSERKYKTFYNFGKDQPLVDAELLSLAIDIMDGNFNCYCKKNEKSALYFSDENNNEVILMPVSSKTKDDVVTEL